MCCSPTGRGLVLAVGLMLLLSAGVKGAEPRCSEFLCSEPSAPVVRTLRFTRDHGPCGLPLDTVPDLLWDAEGPTVLIVPGRRPPTVQPVWARAMARELLAAGRDNVLALDWLLPRGHDLVEGAHQVGKKLAGVIQTLLAKGLTPGRIHLVGFGVGAHVAGVAGAGLHGALGRITGLDPFAPAFTQTNSSLSGSQRCTVCGPNEPVAALGSSQPLGHVDFYIGSGHLLPGCPQGLMGRERYVLCSHQRAHQLFTSSIRAACSLTAFPCKSIADYQGGLCTHCDWPGLRTCPQLGFDITWLLPDSSVPFQPLTAVLDITSVAPFCVTPLLLELQVGGGSLLEAQLFILLKDGDTVTSSMLLSGPRRMLFEPLKKYQFLVSADRDGDFQTVLLEFYTERLLYLDWRKRNLTISHLLLTRLPRAQGKPS
ncbi:hypothetical protein AAFF_G00277230 [Aldrovandia affinis]|uniref:Phospholipase A1 member A n=1 Tax=Aldrovandia affinis TaxID=143900 RepID=A0AAD7RAZ1_9TELE|nr:hypothetical protein AAFF_G00277230 [Aldrovandia affinis]